MPNYFIINPNTTPTNLVEGFRLSFPEERQAELGPNAIKDPPIAQGTDKSKLVRWDGTTLRNLTPAEQAAFDAKVATDKVTSDASEKALLKQAAKDIFVDPKTETHAAIKIAFDVVLRDIFLPEINALRTKAAMPVRTEAQLNQAFRNAFIAAIDAL